VQSADAFHEKAAARWALGSACGVAELDRLDARLADRRYLLGPAPVETDWRLFVTLIRFDAV
jgi:glutathionyl-hydroquinone reductase